MTPPTDPRPIGDDELLVTRVFDAPVALVYALWDRPEHAIRWWGPKEFKTTFLDFQLIPGRPWRACIVSQSGNETWMSGVIRTVEHEKRFVFSFAWEQEGALQTVVTVTFEAQDGRTLQTFHQTPFASVESRDSHVGGWNSFFDNEQAFLADLVKETTQ